MLFYRSIFVCLILSFSSGLGYAQLQPEDIENIKNGLKGKVVFFMGYPGSGKGTQGKIISDLLKIPHVSTGELFRAEAETGSDIGKQMAVFMNQGSIIPSQLTFDYLEDEFGKERYQNGFILDGYPKNRECYDFILGALRRKSLDLLSVIHFDISREETQRRLTERLHCNQCELSYQRAEFKSQENAICKKCQKPLDLRKDDNPKAIGTRLDSYEGSTIQLHSVYKAMGILRSLQVPETPKEMTEKILETLDQDLKRDRQLRELPRSPYYVRALNSGEKENSSIFHNHLDGKDHLLVKEMIQEINGSVPHGQSKIYPVSHLMTGLQANDSEFRDVYAQLPNFHPIENARHEAFATGKMGDQVDYEQTLETLKVAFAHPDQGVMTEIEEEVFGFNMNDEEQPEVSMNRGNTSFQIDWDKLPGWKVRMISKIPRFELHHGFDMEKGSETMPPILVSELMEKTNEAGFRTGGWFIFAKENRWSYRSNEFSNKSYEENVEKLGLQARHLRKIVQRLMPEKDKRKIDSSASLEKVHAIWRVQ